MMVERRALRCLCLAVLGICLLLAAGPAAAQQAADGKAASPVIKIGKEANREGKVAEISKNLEDVKVFLQKEQGELVRWQEALGNGLKRIAQVEKERKKAEGRADKLLAEYYGAIGSLLAQHNETLTQTIDTYSQCQVDLADALSLAGTLAERVEKKDTEEPAPVVNRNLEDVVRYMEEMRLEDVTLALLKARRAGLKEELDQKLKEQSKAAPTVELPSSGEAGTRQDLQPLREEYLALTQRQVENQKMLRRVIRNFTKLELDNLRLQIMAQEDKILALNNGAEAIMALLHVADAEAEEAAKALEKTSFLLPDQKKDINRKIRALRISPPTDKAGGQLVSARKKWELELTLLQHQLYVLDIEEQLGRFRAASILALFRLERNNAPADTFLAEYSWYLDKAKQAKAREELSSRREAWRQEYAFVSSQIQPDDKLSVAVFDLYKELLKTYDQMDTLKWEMEWTAEVVRFFQHRYEIGQRDALWYLWRAGLSLLIFVSAFFLSVVLSKATLGPIRRREDAPSWFRYLMFCSFSGGVIILWAAALAATLSNIWGTILGMEKLSSVFTATLFSIGDSEVSIVSLASLVGVVVVTGIVARLLGSFTAKNVFPYFTWDEGVRHAILAVMKYLIFFGGLALGLEMVGIGLSALALVAGVIGLGIGFGLQNIANNFISGLIILFERPIKKGDIVDAGGLVGRVKEIHARATTIVTGDSVSVIVPNSEFMNGRVINWSHGSELIRMKIPISVAYGTDVPKVTKMLVDVALAEPLVLKEPVPKVWFANFGDNALEFKLLIWTDRVDAEPEIRSRINYVVDDLFRKEKIEVPFPQRDIHIKSLPPVDLRK